MPANIKGAQNIVLEGRGQMTIRPTDHVATGGEGSVYRASNTVIKLYTDTGKMQRDDMPGKIELLKAIDHPYIVAPKGLVTTPSGDPIGYYMNFVSGEPLARIFTNDFRKREGFTDAHAKTLVDRVRNAIRVAHDAGAVLVDQNEMNYMAEIRSQGGPEPRLIDVDSWAIGRWPARVIMPSIRDWHSPKLSQLTDWFAWGIVTFQIFTGIHPYKGTLTGYDRNDLEKRMKANASVFEQGVRLNRNVRDFSCIPGPLLNWYMATFQKGERTPPPSPFDTGVAAPAAALVRRVVTSGSGSLIYDKRLSIPGETAARVFGCGIVLMDSGKLVDLSTRRTIATARSRECEVVAVQGGWLLADWNNGTPEFTFVNGVSFVTQSLSLTINMRRFVSFGNRLFAVTDRGLTELTLTVLSRAILSMGKTWGVMVNSTSWFDGVGVQDALGASYVIAPFDHNACAQVRVRELDGMKPLAAVAGTRYVVVVAQDRKGNYHRVELTFDRNYRTYTATTTNADSPELNLATLPKGVAATIIDDGELQIVVPTTNTVRKVTDSTIATDMRLANWDDRVVYIQNGDVWTVRMK